jgi:hypothetical protein
MFSSKIHYINYVHYKIAWKRSTSETVLFYEHSSEIFVRKYDDNDGGKHDVDDVEIQAKKSRGKTFFPTILLTYVNFPG